jgi:hypothetical protein
MTKQERQERLEALRVDFDILFPDTPQDIYHLFASRNPNVNSLVNRFDLGFQPNETDHGNTTESRND